MGEETGAIKKEIQERGLEILVRNEGFQFKNSFFPYTSGQIGPYYIQSGVVMNNGRDYKTALTDMKLLIELEIHNSNSPNDLGFDVISGGESRDWIFSNPLAPEFSINIPLVMLYKDGKVVSKGSLMNGKRVLHIADLNNEGSSPRDLWVPIIKNNGGTIKDIVFYVDRLEDGVEEMQKLGLNRHVVVPLDSNAWNYLQNMPESGVTPEIYKNLMERMENKEAWAEKMLTSNKGIAELKKLYNSEKTKAKAEKIIKEGYPHLNLLEIIS